MANLKNNTVQILSSPHETLQVSSPAKGGEPLNILGDPDSQPVICSPSQSLNFQILMVPNSESSLPPPSVSTGAVQGTSPTTYSPCPSQGFILLIHSSFPKTYS